MIFDSTKKKLENLPRKKTSDYTQDGSLLKDGRKIGSFSCECDVKNPTIAATKGIKNPVCFVCGGHIE